MVEKNPKKAFIFGFSVFFALALCFYLGVEFGIVESKMYRTKAKELESAFRQLKEERKGVEVELAAARLTLEIQEKMINDLRAVISSSASNGQKMLEELKFYQQVISNYSGNKGITVSGVRFIKLGQTGEYEFDLVLRQRGDFRRSVNVELKIDIAGQSDGFEKSYSIDDLGEFSDYPVKAKFRHFFRQTGVVKFPEGFDPSATVISLKSVGGDYKKSSFSWLATLQVAMADN